MKIDGEVIDITDGALELTPVLVPWDTDVFGFVVAELLPFRFTQTGSPSSAFARLKYWRDRENVQLMYCRLPCDSLEESMQLEEHGFRFIEVVLHPTIPNLQERKLNSPKFSVSTANPNQVEAIAHVAELVFGNERYHADPRVDSKKASARYGRWVRNSSEQPTYSLLKIESAENEIVGFFATEVTAPRQVTWRLTAVAPQFQGQGLGPEIWMSVLNFHQSRGTESVVSTIASRNVRVLDLYSQLNFRFNPPEMTFHWIREGMQCR